MGVGQQLLAAVLNPFDRAAVLARQGDGDELVRVDLRLVENDVLVVELNRPPVVCDA